MMLVTAFALPASAATYEAKSRALVTAEESCPNGAIDPGETNVVSFVIKNTSGGTLNNVKPSLVVDGNIEFSLEGEKNIGNMANNEEKTVTFRFRTKGACGATLTPKLLVKRDGDTTGETLTFGDFQLGLTVNTTYPFSNTSPITINDFTANGLGKASPYPSQITVAGVPHSLDNLATERVDKVTVTLTGVTHPYSQDIRALLVGPGGQKIVLMADAGGSTAGTAPVNNINLTFDQAAGGGLPPNAQLTTGSYRPTANGAGAFPDEPGGTLTTTLNDFNAINPNGNWRLFVIDDQAGDSGVIAGGWTLNIRTKRISCCGAGQTFPFITKDGVPTLTNLTIDEDTIFSDETISGAQKHSPTYAFKIGDLEDAGGDLTVTRSSSNEGLILSSNIKLGGSGNDRTLQFKTVPNAFGTSQITVTVTDKSGRSSSATFTLTVTSINDEPFFSSAPRNQAANVGTATALLPFVVGDVETPPENLIVTGESSNTAVVPQANIVFESTAGANRTVRIIPANNSVSGTATITLRVQDGNNASTPHSFVVSFNTPVGNPTIEPINDTSTQEDVAKSIVFAIRNAAGTSSDGLTLSREIVAANPAGLIPVENIVFSGTGVDRTVTITPAADLYGTATIKISVTEAGNKTSSREFVLTVTEVNDAPTITSTIGEQIINEDSETATLAFTIADKETVLNPVINNGVTEATGAVWAQSSNTGLVPNNVANIIVAGTGANRTIKIKPAANAYGRATITVFFRDTGTIGTGAMGTAGLDVKTASATFLVTVNAVNDAPTIAQVNDVNLASNETDAPEVFTTPEDAADVDNPQGRFVDGDPAKGVIELSLALQNITAGAGIETEQTVTISATTDRPDLITGIRFAGSENQVKSPTVNTTLRFKPVRNAHGTATITLTLTDNGTGAAGGDNRTTIRKFKIVITPVNDLPTFGAISNPPAQALNETILIPLNVSDVETSNNNITATVEVLDQRQFRTVGGVRSRIDPNDGGFVLLVPGKVLVDPIKSKVTLTPETDAEGEADVRITMTDRGATDNGTGPASIQRTFTVDWSGLVIVNKAPVITGTPTLPAIDEDAVASTTISFTDDGPADQTVLKVISISDTSIVPLINVGFTSTGNTRTMIVAPAANKFGTVTITIVAQDLNGNGLSSEPKTLTLTVRPVEDNPTITLLNTGDSAWTPANGNPVTITANEDANPVKDSQGRLVELTVTDAETIGDSLNLSVTSKNPANLAQDSAVVPPGNITVTKNGNGRSLSIVPAANLSGRARLTATVTDEANRTASVTFDVLIRSVNDKPEIAQVTNQAIDEDAGTININLTGLRAGGGETGQVLTLTHDVKDKGGNSNTLLENISFTPATVNTPNNDGQTATFSFRPIADKFGTSVVKIIVTDDAAGTETGGNQSTEMTFEVLVREVNDAPTIPTHNLTDQSATLGVTSFGPLGFTVADLETSINSLVITFTSDNTALVPNNQGTTTAANLQLTGSGSTRGIIVRPVPNVAGVANIEVKVTDGGKLDGTDKKSATRTFKVTVDAGVNPRVSPIADINLDKGAFSDIISFNIADGQSQPSELILTRSSNNQDVVPNANIQFAANDTGATRRLIVRAGTLPGTATVTITATDPQGNTGSSSFKVNVRGDAPTISQITSRTIALNGTTGPIPFTIGDTETFPGFLVLQKTSSNTTYMPLDNIVFFGTGADRAVALTPAQNQSGSSIITITVVDDQGQTASTTFTVTTENTNQPPTISTIADRSIVKGSNTGAISFTIGDDATPVANLTLTKSSSNTALVSNDNVVLGGSGANRTVQVNPVATATGETTITITVSDGDKQASTSFKVTVTEPILNHDDFNKDGKTDLIFQDNNGFLAAWYMNGASLVGASLLNPNNVGDPNWRVIDSGDFNGDNMSDLFFQHSDGTLAAWFMNGVNQTSASFLTPATPGDTLWKAVSTGDINLDGKTDVLFQNVNGTLATWYLNGVTATSMQLVTPNHPGDIGWKAVGLGKVDADQNLDIVFQHADGTLAVWLMNGSSLINNGALLFNPSHPGDANWRVAGVADLNNDGRADLLFQHATTSEVGVWFMNGINLTEGRFLNPNRPDGTLKIVAP